MNSLGFNRNIWPTQRNIFLKGAALHVFAIVLTVALLVVGFFLIGSGTGEDSLLSEPDSLIYLLVACVPGTIFILPVYAFVTRTLWKRLGRVSFWKRHVFSAAGGGLSALLLYGITFSIAAHLLF